MAILQIIPIPPKQLLEWREHTMNTFPVTSKTGVTLRK